MTYDPNAIPIPSAKIKVIGVGGGGTNAVSTMVRENIEGVEFIAVNTDIQSLKSALAPTKIQIGKELTKGLGAGANPNIGRDAALEDRFEIQEAIGDADMVFITAGMGGGTGTGSASIISQIAREMGALTVGVVTKPFHFEGQRRRRHAQLGIESLREQVDTLITIPNQKLLQIASPDLSMVAAFQMADTVLVNAVRGISDIINIPGTINVDFADVKTIMSNMGQALMGIGVASGEGRAIEAAKQAISSPLLEDVDIEGATGILINITAGEKVSLLEVNEACLIVQEAAHEDANVIFGVVIDETLAEQIQVTVIATGFPQDDKDEFAKKEETKNKILSDISSYNSQNLIIPHRKRVVAPTASILTQKDPLLQKTTAKPKAQTKPFERAPQAEQIPAKQPVEPKAPTPPQAPAQTAATPPVATESLYQEAPIPAPIQTKQAPVEPQAPRQEQRPAEPSFSQAQAPAVPEETSPIEMTQTLEQPIVTQEQAHTEPAQPYTGTMAPETVQSHAQEPQTPSAQQETQAATETQTDKSEYVVNNKNIADDIDKKIDDALQLAQRIKEIPVQEDDLDIPAFLRQNLEGTTTEKP